MKNLIEISEGHYAKLAKAVDTADDKDSTVEKLVIDAINHVLSENDIQTIDSMSSSKEEQTYEFNGQLFVAKDLVLNVVTEYVSQQEGDINLYELSQAFPNEIQGDIGIANKFYDVVSRYDGQDDKKHFISESEMLDLQEGKIAISTEWDNRNIYGFVSRARQLGFVINGEGATDSEQAFSENKTDEEAPENKNANFSKQYSDLFFLAYSPYFWLNALKVNKSLFSNPFFPKR